MLNNKENLEKIYALVNNANEELGQNIKITEDQETIIISDGENTNFVIKGVQDGDKVYVVIDEIIIRPDNVDNDVVSQIESAINSLYDFFNMFPYLKGVDINDETSVRRRMVYTIYYHRESFNVLCDEFILGLSFKDEDSEELDNAMDHVTTIRNFFKFVEDGFEQGHINNEGNVINPVENPELYEEEFEKFATALNILVGDYQDFSDRFSVYSDEVFGELN